MSKENEAAEGPDLSRRGFLTGVGAGTMATGLLTGITEEVEAAQRPALVGPGGVPITLNINGKQNKVAVEPRTTLLDALRNRLDMTGAKKVCDRGTCGACTVLLDGEPAYACSMLAIEAEGRKITTIEGIGTPEHLTALQKSFIENDGQQCGFCTPGFVMACTAFLEKHPNPTLEEVQAGLGGNLCRCGTYVGITAAMLDTAKKMKGGA